MLRIYASELAACLGRNRYVHPQETAAAMWERNFPLSFIAALRRNPNYAPPVPIEVKVEELNLKEKVTEAIKASTPQLVEKILGEILKMEKVTPDVASEITSLIFTTRGSEKEEISLDKFQVDINKKVLLRNTNKYIKEITYGDDKTVQLTGKVDGITEDNVLVEMKNRQRKFFDKIPEYEKIQMHAYMAMTGIYMYVTEGIKECHYVQSFKDETRSEVLNFDNEFWRNIEEEIVIFAGIMDILKEDIQLQDAVVDGVECGLFLPKR